MEQRHRIIAIALFVIGGYFGRSFGTLDPARPRFVNSPENVFVTEGETAVLQCEIENFNYSANYFGTWYKLTKSGHSLLTMGDVAITMNSRVRISSSKTNSWQLIMSEATLKDDGVYFCMVERWPFPWMAQFRILNVIAKPKKLNNIYNERISSQLDVLSNVRGAENEISTQFRTNENTETATERLKILINSTTSESFPKTSPGNKSTTKPRNTADIPQTLVSEESIDNTETESKNSLGNQSSHIISSASSTETQSVTELSIATEEQEKGTDEATTESPQNSTANSIETTLTKESENITDETNSQSDETSGNRSSLKPHTQTSNGTTYTKEAQTTSFTENDSSDITEEHETSTEPQNNSTETSIDETSTKQSEKTTDETNAQSNEMSSDKSSPNIHTEASKETRSTKESKNATDETKSQSDVSKAVSNNSPEEPYIDPKTASIDGKSSSSGPDLYFSSSSVSTEGTTREVTEKQVEAQSTQNPSSLNLNSVVTAISLTCTAAIVIALIGYIVHNHRKRIKARCRDEQEIHLL